MGVSQSDYVSPTDRHTHTYIAFSKPIKSFGGMKKKLKRKRRKNKKHNENGLDMMAR